MAASLAYVVDRATYWSGGSKGLLHVVDLIKQADPLVAIAPQIQVRKARVLKDEGDLHGAMKVLDDILERRQSQAGEWKYIDEDQYVTTKAEIIKIKGHILYNLGLLKEAVEPFLESISLFASLNVKDDKGIASCLGLLTKCLGKLSLEEFRELRNHFSDYFEQDHPYLESYVQGLEAVKHIDSLHESLYSSRHLLDADTSLLKYAVLRPSVSELYKLLQTILDEMRRSLGAHKTIDALSSSEQFFEFVRALFMINLSLAFSPVQQDRNLAEYIQEISIELYLHLCIHNKVQRVPRLAHTMRSVRLINLALTVLGLPSLLGEISEQNVLSENRFLGRPGTDPGKMRISQAEGMDLVGCDERDEGGDKENLKKGLDNGNIEDQENGRILQGREERAVKRIDCGGLGVEAKYALNKFLLADCETGTDTEEGFHKENVVRQLNEKTEQNHARSHSSHAKPENTNGYLPEKFSLTHSVVSQRCSIKDSSASCSSKTSAVATDRGKDIRQNKTFRGWTYNFGHKTIETPAQGEQVYRTFPSVNHGEPLDPKKQWQTYKHKCVGLPVDPNFFSSPTPLTSLSSCEDDCEIQQSLVNLSVPYIRETLANRATSEGEKTEMKYIIVNRQATTVSSNVSKESPLGSHKCGVVNRGATTVSSIASKESPLGTHKCGVVNRGATTVSSNASEESPLGPRKCGVVNGGATTVSSNASKESPLGTHKCGVVNREATTASSNASEESPLQYHPHDLIDQPMRSEQDKNQVAEDVEISTFSPLVDLKETSISELLNASLGKGIDTDNAIEYINNWHPPSSEPDCTTERIQRAFLLNFNPMTGIWTSQSTLAFLGDTLDLAEDKKGQCRDAFHVQFLHQDEPRGRYVGKRYRDGRHHKPARYMQDVVCQMMAGYYVTKFNEALKNYKRDIQVQFLPAAHLQLLTPNGDIEDCINVEPYLHGDFIKLTNNFAFANMKHEGEAIATALSHFSYCESKGAVMIVDIQGWVPKDVNGVIYLTDPQFHTNGVKRFSPYDYQKKGMKHFWKYVHPECNDMCRAIDLERVVV